MSDIAAFVQAARDGCLADMTRLRPRVNVNAEDGNGNTALEAAVALECFEAARWLVYHGARVDVQATYHAYALLASEHTSVGNASRVCFTKEERLLIHSTTRSTIQQ